jgi:DeoR/GlpR family transcriptional regulator of sugar metabolism
MEHICDLKDIDILVTDSGILEETYEKYSRYMALIKA